MVKNENFTAGNDSTGIQLGTPAGSANLHELRIVTYTQLADGRAVIGCISNHQLRSGIKPGKAIQAITEQGSIIPAGYHEAYRRSAFHLPMLEHFMPGFQFPCPPARREQTH